MSTGGGERGDGGRGEGGRGEGGRGGERGKGRGEGEGSIGKRRSTYHIVELCLMVERVQY